MGERLSSRARLFAFDVDPSAVAVGRALEREDSRFRIFHRPFAEMAEALPDVRLDGVLLDIGVSGPQVDSEDRGFRMAADGPLDLRMNPTKGVPASEWLEGVSAEELAWVIHAYGEHKDALLSERIAEAVVAKRRHGKRYCTGRDLSDVVRVAKGIGDWKMHPARLTFQAIRMFLNHELDQLRLALDAAFDRLVHGGRCIVIAFKRSESDVVNKWIRQHEDAPWEVLQETSPARLCELYPLVATDLDYSVRRLVLRSRPRDSEVLANRRSRSSSLMVLVKAAREARRITADPPRTAAERFQRPDPPTFAGELRDMRSR